jgi:DNA topoisomerase-1
MAAAVFDATTMDFDVAGEKFRSKGRVLKFDGFLAIYQELQASEEEEEIQRLPPVSEGELVPKRGEELAEKMTKPPGRYTEGALVKALERLGIGRPSTYATIMQVIKARGYVRIEKGKLVPEPAGETIIDYLTKKHPWITELDLTRRMEVYLDKVEGGNRGAS